MWMPLHARTHPILRGLALQCRMTPASKYAVDTKRMIVTGRFGQGVPRWPQTKNNPGDELLRRYDMYPKPNGKESQDAKSIVHDSPPTGPPHGQILYLQEGAYGTG